MWTANISHSNAWACSLLTTPRITILTWDSVKKVTRSIRVEWNWLLRDILLWSSDEGVPTTPYLCTAKRWSECQIPVKFGINVRNLKPWKVTKFWKKNKDTQVLLRVTLSSNTAVLVSLHIQCLYLFHALNGAKGRFVCFKAGCIFPSATGSRIF